MSSWKKVKNFINHHQSFLLWLLIFIYIVFFGAFCLWKLDNFLYNAIDLSIFNQVFFNTLHGQWFATTINLNNYLGDHFSPVIILLLPFYALKPGPEILVIIQSIFLGLSAWPLYKISQTILADKNLSLLVSLVWLLNPFVHSANIYEFHLFSLAVFLLFWTFYWYQKNHWFLFLLFFILTLTVREDISLLLLGFAPLAWLDHKSLRWKIIPLIMGLAYFFLSLKLIGLFSPVGNSKFFIYYGWLGGHGILTIIWSWLSHPLLFLAHILRPRNIFFPLIIVTPLLFIPWLRPKYFWLAVLPFLQILLSVPGFANYVYVMHYSLLFMPAIFIAFIFGWQKLQRRENFLLSGFIYKNKAFSILLFIITISYFLIFLSPLTQAFSVKYKNYHADDFRLALGQFRLEDKIIASDIFLPALSSRQTLYRAEYVYQGQSQFGYTKFVPEQADYVLVDYDSFLSNLNRTADSPYLQTSADQLSVDWRQWLNQYHLVKAEESLLLWADKIDNPSDSLPLVSIKPLAPTSTNDLILDSRLFEQVDQKVLQLTLQNILHQDQQYLIRFYRQDGYFDLPLLYGLWTAANWPTDQVLDAYYYLRPDISAYQIFSWEGMNKFGQVGQVVGDLQVTPITAIIAL